MKPTKGYFAPQTASATPLLNYQKDYQSAGSLKEESDNRGIFLKDREYLGRYSDGQWWPVPHWQDPQSSVFVQYNHKDNVEVAVATVFSGKPEIDEALKGNLEFIASIAKTFFLTFGELQGHLPDGATDEPTWEQVCEALADWREHHNSTISMHSEVWVKTMTVEEARELLKALNCGIVLPE